MKVTLVTLNRMRHSLYCIMACTICATLLVHAHVCAQGHPLKFERLSVELGLSQNSVYSIVQDSKGFMWFGTADGLNRFDGYRVTIYRHHPGNPHSLSHNTVRVVFVDRDGVLWAGTEGGGLNMFNPETEEFTRYQHDPDDPFSLSHNAVSSLYEDRAGNFWVGTWGGGLNILDRATGRFTQYRHDPEASDSLSSDAINLVYEDRAGTFWVGTQGGGLNTLDRKTGTCVRYRAVPDSSIHLSNDVVFALYEDRAGAFWIGTEDGLNILDRTTGRFAHLWHYPRQPYSLSSNDVRAIYEDASGFLWIGTFGGGLDLFDPASKRFTHYRHDPTNPKSLSQDAIRAMYADQSGLIWVGTDLGGVNRFQADRKFIHYQHEPDNPNSLSDNAVLAFVEDRQGFLWVGTREGGLDRIDRTTGQYRHYQHHPDDPASLSDNAVTALHVGRSGILWVGTWGGGVNIFDRQTGSFLRYRHNPNMRHSLSDDRVSSIYEDQLGFIWFGTSVGMLSKFDRKTGLFTHYPIEPDRQSDLPEHVIYTIREDHTGMLWLATSDGLAAFDRHTQHVTLYRHTPDDPDSISANTVYSLHIDAQGVIWAGTEGGGLNQFDRERTRFRHYRERGGGLNDTIYGILGDQQGHIWMSTQNGLAMFDPGRETFTQYPLKDDQQHRGFHERACYISPRGEMFFGGVNGFHAFFPQQVTENPYIPPVVLTDLQVLNRSVPIGADVQGKVLLERSISTTSVIPFSYKHSMFSFEFAVLDYADPAENQYAYMLEGFDKNWLYSGTRRFTTYTNVPGGSYIFRVKGSTHEGVWNEEGIALAMTITPPLWKTWWAYGLYGLTFLALLAGYIRHQQRTLERERRINGQLRQSATLKDEFFATTAHELRAPLNGIVGLADSLLDGVTGDVTAAMRKNLAMIVASGLRLSNLVNDILDSSKLTTHHLHIRRKALNIKEAVDMALMVSEPLLAGKEIQLLNDIADDIPVVDADEDRLQQILLNLLSNAIAFTESGTVSVSAMTSPDEVAISVSDTGIGISKAQFETIFQSFEQVNDPAMKESGGTGLGLAVTRHLVELHGGIISVASEVGRGATFTFTLPISEEEPDELLAGNQRLSTLQALKDYGHTDFVSGDVSEYEPEGEFSLLVVDDDLMNQHVLSNYLSGSNCCIIQASNGTEALDILESGEPVDLVLLDILLPGMSGYEVAQKIRERYLPSELPIIMLTAKNQVDDLVQGFACGANDYLVKPTSKAELLARITTHLHLLTINSSYRRFIPVEYLRFLDKQNILDVQLGDHTSQDMAIMFSGIRAFTTLSDTMTPQEHFNFVNAYLKRMNPVIKTHNGLVVKFMGDGLMTVFPDGVADAVNAGLEKLQEIAEYNRHRQEEGWTPIHVGIGVHFGHMMIGMVGQDDRMQGEALSANINVTSRLEGLTQYYGVSFIISGEVLHALPDATNYHVRFLDKVQVKGCDNPMMVYEIFNADPEPLIRKKLKTFFQFEAGQRYYFTSDFNEAITCFQRVLEVNPEDRTARLYLDRSTQCLQNGVPGGWKGIERRTGA